MKRLLKWLAGILGAVVIVLVAGFLFAYFSSEAKINRTYDVPVAEIAIPDPDSAVVARGRHIALTHGCMDCHGADLSGTLFLDGMPVARVSSSNLTPAGPVASYSDTDWIRSIRHGIRPDGTSFWVMPSAAYSGLSEEDLGALVAFLKTLKPVEGQQDIHEVGPLGRMLIATGQMKISAMKVDHGRAYPVAPPEGPTPEYGAYLIDECRYCHGPELRGGLREGDPSAPLSSNLTPSEDGIGHYTYETFNRALRTGAKPDGTIMEPAYMPWTATTHFTDTEVEALWAYLQTLEPAPMGP